MKFYIHRCLIPNYFYSIRSYHLKTKLYNHKINKNDVPQKDVNKLPRIYINQLLNQKSQIFLNDENTHYISNVMRLKNGYYLRIFNENNGEYLAKVHIEQKNKVHSIYLDVHENLRLVDNDYIQQSILPCILLFAPIKKNRMKILLEKATELGIHYLVPINTQNTQYFIESIEDKESSIESYHKILIQSTEQSERLIPPILCNPITFDDLVNDHINNKNDDNTNNGNNIRDHNNVLNEMNSLLVCYERIGLEGIPLLQSLSKLTLHNSFDINKLSRQLALLIGPEGGFSMNELKVLKEISNINSNENKRNISDLNNVNIELITLGNNVLRAETAVISALSSISAWKESLLYQNYLEK